VDECNTTPISLTFSKHNKTHTLINIIAMNLKTILLRVVLSNLHDPTIKELYNKAFSLYTSSIAFKGEQPEEPKLGYLKVYRHYTFKAIAPPNSVTEQLYKEIVGNNQLIIPVRYYYDEYMIQAHVIQASGSFAYHDIDSDLMTEPQNIDVYNQLIKAGESWKIQE
jgi:hypothetical protein